MESKGDTWAVILERQVIGAEPTLMNGPGHEPQRRFRSEVDDMIGGYLAGVVTA